jgi:hypothetical protein
MLLGVRAHQASPRLSRSFVCAPRGSATQEHDGWSPVGPNAEQLTGVVAMAQDPRGKTIAVLATDGVEQVELTEPVNALNSAGVVAPKPGTIQGFNHHEKRNRIPVDATLDQADASHYDALVLPGGVINPDVLRLESRAVRFVRAFVQSSKPIAAICH